MKLHNETVSPRLIRCLKTIMQSDIFKDFNLVGGTCLSLQLGHRRSIDIDLFTAIDYGSMNTTAMKVFLQENFPYSENLDSLDQPALGYSVRIGESPADCIKADFFYTENFIFPVKQTDGIRLADIREIAAMKIKAITQEEPRQKDFWDIYELNNTYSLKEMIEWAMMRDEWSFTKNDIKAGFERIFDVKECPEGIDCYRGYAWELISMDLKAAAEEYFNQEKDYSFLLLGICLFNFRNICSLSIKTGYLKSLYLNNNLKSSSSSSDGDNMKKIANTSLLYLFKIRFHFDKVSI